MRFQTVSPRFSSAEIHALMRATEGPPAVVSLGVSTIEQLARELADARMVIECARHLSVLVRPPVGAIDRLGRGRSASSLRERIEEAWSDLDEAQRDYFGGPLPVVDGELDP